GLCEIADLREGCRVPLRAVCSRRTADQGQDQKDACRDKVTRALGGGGTFQVQVQCAENLFGEFLRKVSSRESIPRQTKVKEGGRLCRLSLLPPREERAGVRMAQPVHGEASSAYAGVLGP